MVLAPRIEGFFLTGFKTLTLQCSTTEIGDFGKGDLSCTLVVKQKKAVPCFSQRGAATRASVLLHHCY